jgi:hypothetical protein
VGLDGEEWGDEAVAIFGFSEGVGEETYDLSLHLTPFLAV